MDQKIAQFLEDAAGRDPDNQVTLTVRELLSIWGAKRRGYWIVEQIERDLAEARVTTAPSFIDGWIDNSVTLIPLTKATGRPAGANTTAEVVEATDASLPEVALRVGGLPSANITVASVEQGATLLRAQSIMMRHDYSQLAVMSGPRTLRGAVTWESIAQARIRNPGADLRAATVSAETVTAGDDLLSQIPRIMRAGFVFVVAPDRTLQGIVTTADLSQQFADLAGPFFVLAEIERRLRRIIDRTFSADDLRAAADPADSSRQPESADHLTIGECVRLLERPTNWARLKWQVDRVVFIEALDGVRRTRNEIMHFSPDPLEPVQITELNSFAKWLRTLDPDT